MNLTVLAEGYPNTNKGFWHVDFLLVFQRTLVTLIRPVGGMMQKYPQR